MFDHERPEQPVIAYLAQQQEELAEEENKNSAEETKVQEPETCIFLDDDDIGGFDSLMKKAPKQGVGGGSKQPAGGGLAQKPGGGNIWSSGPGLDKIGTKGGGYRLDHAMFKNE